MKAFRIILILSVFYSLFSCSREVSVISGYKKLAKELKTNSNNYTIEDFQEVALEIQNWEQEAESCNFTKEQQKEVNRLRGKCIGYFIKGISQQSEDILKDFSDRISDIKEGYDVAFDEN